MAPELAFHRYWSQVGAVAVTVTAPLLPAPGAARIKLKPPAAATGRKCEVAATGQPTPDTPGVPESRTQVSPEIRLD